MTDPHDPRAPRPRAEGVEGTTVIEEDAVWYEQPWMIAGIVLLVLLLILLAWLIMRDDDGTIVLAPSPTPTPPVVVTPTPTPAVTLTPTPVVTPTPTPTPLPVETVTVPPDEAVTRPAPEPHQISGAGSQTTAPIDHTGGLAIIQFRHQGGGMTITVVEDGGGDVESITTSEGVEQGARAFGLDEGTYRLQIEAEGNWDVSFEQPRFVEGEELPATIEGNGDTATDPFEVPDKTVRFAFEHEAASPLEVRVLDAETGEVVAEFTAGDGDAHEEELPAGLYLLDVQAPDRWQAVLS